MDAATPRASPRTKDPERTRADILAVATEEFSAFGLSGARVDAIAERTRTSKRMIYYYFGSKEGLYLAVLEKAYADIRQVEADLDLGALSPAEAIRRLVEFTFEYDDAHPDFIRLVTIENIHRAEHLSGSETIRGLNLGVIETITDIIARGQREGCFRADVDPLDVHMMISALCFFRVSNRHTFGAIFSVNLDAPDLRARHKHLIGDAVIGMLATR
ncbi:TetR family transcriptional regulator [Methylobacterium variabile]|jgi:AcrR family transcriptional regulator|uniref:TetR family transcriptional regulator n=1 Tax=Methylobacterium variabile TaxID=298794 RepID=A0A0J6S760_9HYPH|nr:TetR family transcriptional regulator [Methylobacterium variabile]KMO29263.1 TetR family transcriptional regulator [Methylobacterium variabile]